MKTFKRECPMCGKEFIYEDVRSVPTTCGRLICETNFTYQTKHMDPVTGDYPSPDKVKKWKN